MNNSQPRHLFLDRNSLMKFLILLLLVASSAWAQSTPPLTGTFSNLTYLEEEGDVTGMEITIIPSGSAGNYSYHALIQIAEGEPAAPQLVPVNYDGQRLLIVFNYPGAGGVTFEGKLSGTSLSGNLTGTQFASTKYVLPRKASYWQQSARRK